MKEQDIIQKRENIEYIKMRLFKTEEQLKIDNEILKEDEAKYLKNKETLVNAGLKVSNIKTNFISTQN